MRVNFVLVLVSIFKVSVPSMNKPHPFILSVQDANMTYALNHSLAKGNQTSTLNIDKTVIFFSPFHYSARILLSPFVSSVFCKPFAVSMT